jgi:type 2 lantibiotic biosynthesis protein LanM
VQRVPFDEVLLSFVRFACGRLRNQAATCVDLLSAEALGNLERTLLRKLSIVCSRPLALELNVERLLGKLHGETPQERYFDFIKNRIATPHGMIQFFSEYSVAGRLVALQVDQWIDSSVEFLSRLDNDLSEIKSQFTGGQDPGKVIEILDHLSDVHNHGRTTKQLTFASGLKLIYKPKNLTVDAAFQNFLEWINAQEKLLPLKSFRILNRKTHGWAEFIPSEPCRDLEEVNRYFIRAGMHLCLLHALGGSDCHHENLIACGEYPVIIDLENLLELQPARQQEERRNADQLGQEICKMSLLYTGMLPRLTFGDAGAKGVDFSSLTGGNAQIPFRFSEWVKTETDEMQLESAYRTLSSGPSRLMLNDREVSTFAYLEKLEEGFREMYRFLLEFQTELWEKGLLDGLCEGEIRYLNRSTAEYSLILQKSLDPAYLKEGIDRSIYLDLLFRQLLFRDQESFWKLVKAERRAMERMDVPYFTSGAKETVLISDRCDPVADFVMTPAADRLRDRLARLNEEDRNRQILFLRGSWSIHTGSVAKSRSELKSDVPLLNRERLIETAAAIGESIKNLAIRSADGSVSWIGAEFVPDLNQFSIVPGGNSLYSGKPGIALFLAALDRIVPGEGYADLSLGALQTIRELFRGKKAQFYMSMMGIGAMSGIGSICWSLLRVGELLRNQDLIEDAVRIGTMISQDRIASDRYLDVIGGSAGTVLSLLALYSRLPDSALLKVAEQCGDHLLKQSVLIAPGGRAWRTIGGEMLTGFAHGTSGYAYALFRLYEATEKEEYRNSALQAFAYEKSLFSPERRNWPDLRKDIPGEPGTKFMIGWCHGAPGITLARIASLAQVDSIEIREEIEVGLDTTLKAKIVTQDDLCCGNFSRIEALLLASQYLNRPDLHRAALDRASIVAQYASEERAFCLHPSNRDGIVNPGLMKGISGIGYSLLRLADPELPSPLLM